MNSDRIRRLVVVNETQEVVGIISLDDILELLAEERQALEAVMSVMRAARREKVSGLQSDGEEDVCTSGK